MDQDTNTCIEINECLLPNLCAQICVDALNSYTCSCHSGFVLNTLDGITCLPSSNCTDEQRLHCDGGNLRSTCAVDITNGQILCECPHGYALNGSIFCEDINECATWTDMCNEGTSICVNMEGGYKCTCKPGYQHSPNSTIECVDIDECIAVTHNCSSTAFCVNGVGSYICGCITGYTFTSNGMGCEDFNECNNTATNTCDKEDAVCTNLAPLFRCECKEGYTGDGYTCVDLNECALPSKGGCSQSCHNSIGNFSCSCLAGYTLNPDRKTCNNINECSNEIDNDCYSNNYCNDTIGSYTCSCPVDFRLKADGRTCESIYECAAGHGCSYTCGKIGGIDTCQCQHGMELGKDNKTCIDINECTNSTLHNCQQENNVMCSNTNMSYECKCINSSYTQVERTICIDVDECASGAHSCPIHSKCVNAAPGFTCLCLTGYIKIGGVCQDDDECIKGTHTCHPTNGQCTNTDGSYTCSCKTGYGGNGVVCTDINECAVGTHTCDKRLGRGLCTNTDGSYICSCSTGYILAPDGVNCNDFDECARETDNCSEICTNTDGGYLCSCQTSFRLAADQRTCIVEKACNATSAPPCEYQCTSLNGTDTCVCRTGYKLSGLTACIDIDDCTESQPCDVQHGFCTNTNGSYTCSCLDNYILGPGNTCRDRNGGFTVWSLWLSCSKICGGGTRMRTRTCTNPTPAGNGAPCNGSASETEVCNSIPCPASDDESNYGVLVQFSGLTVSQFASIKLSFAQSVAHQTNKYCNQNAAHARLCCNSNLYYNPDPNNTLEFTNVNNVLIGEDYPLLVDGHVTALVVSKYSPDSELCSTLARDGTDSKRKKRSIVLAVSELALLKGILQEIFLLYMQDLTTDMETQIKQTLGLSLNISLVAVIPVSSALNNNETPELVGKSGIAVWIIILSVMTSVLLIIVIMVIIIIIFKLKTNNKVHTLPIEQRSGNPGPSSNRLQWQRSRDAEKAEEHDPQLKESVRNLRQEVYIHHDNNIPDVEECNHDTVPQSRPSSGTLIHVVPASESET